VGVLEEVEATAVVEETDGVLLVATVVAGELVVVAAAVEDVAGCVADVVGVVVVEGELEDFMVATKYTPTPATIITTTRTARMAVATPALRSSFTTDLTS